MTIPSEAFDAGVRPVRDIKPLRAGRDGDTVRGAELPGRVTFAAKDQIVPDCLEGVRTQNPGGQDVIEIRIACSDVIKPAEFLHIGGREVPSAQKIVVNFRLLEFVLGCRGIERIDQVAIERRGEDLAGVVCGKNEVRAAILRKPDGGVMQVHILHVW